MKILYILTLFSFTLFGCGADKREDSKKMDLRGTGDARARNETLSRAGWNIKEFDLNRDDKPDQWILSNKGTQRIERDLNFDGKVDLWQYPNADGSIVEEEMDLDLDQKVDLVIFYEKGVVTRKELSTDFSGVFNIIKYYDAAGNLLRLERDEDGDGDIDTWEYYESNRAVRIGWDTTNDGKPDTFDDLS